MRITPGCRAGLQRPGCCRLRLTLLSCVWCVSLAVYAGPPIETDDPDTPGPGRWEVNLASTMEKRASFWEFQPLLDVNYGWGERVQLKLKPRAVVLDEPGAGAKAGAGNLQFGVKWRFVDQQERGLSLSVYPQADLNPPGNSVERGLVADGQQFLF